MTSIFATNTTIYIKDTGSGNLLYQIGDISGSWNTISSFPLSIHNTNQTNTSILVVQFYTDITINTINTYFVISTEYVNFNGNNKNITIDNVSNYPGLLQNGTDNAGTNANNNINVSNLIINVSGTTTLLIGGGLLLVALKLDIS